jgi:hypothetical protein
MVRGSSGVACEISSAPVQWWTEAFELPSDRTCKKLIEHLLRGRLLPP